MDESAHCPACGSSGLQQVIGMLWDRPQTIFQCMACDRFYLEPAPAQIRPNLSEQEKRILSLLATGNPKRTVARGLEMSIRTLEVYQHVIMDKLGATNRGEMIQKAVEIGLLQNE